MCSDGSGEESSQDVEFFGFIRVSLAGKNSDASGTRRAITEAKKHMDQDKERNHSQ
jgi:hypothetical protein